MTSALTGRLTGRAWAYIGAGLGGAVSIAANVAHSYVPPAGMPATWSPPLGAVVGAVFWPAALFVAIEILARAGWPAGARWVVLRYLGLLPVAVVAAVVSYRHLAGLLDFYGEDPLTVTIGPLAVDGLMVMATGALIATGRRAPSDQVTDRSAGDGTHELTPPGRDENTSTTTSPADDTGTTGAPADRAQPRPKSRPARRTRSATPDASRAETAAAVARLRRAHPDMSAPDIAKRLGVTDRTVRRHLAAHRATEPTALDTADTTDTTTDTTRDTADGHTDTDPQPTPELTTARAA